MQSSGYMMALVSELAPARPQDVRFTVRFEEFPEVGLQAVPGIDQRSRDHDRTHPIGHADANRRATLSTKYTHFRNMSRLHLAKGIWNRQDSLGGELLDAVLEHQVEGLGREVTNDVRQVTRTKQGGWRSARAGTPPCWSRRCCWR